MAMMVDGDSDDSDGDDGGRVPGCHDGSPTLQKGSLEVK